MIIVNCKPVGEMEYRCYFQSGKLTDEIKGVANSSPWLHHCYICSPERKNAL